MKKKVSPDKKIKKLKINKLLIATTNSGKFNELKKYLACLPFKIISLADLKINQSAKENGQNFQENAIIKAEFYCRLAKLATIADDGGLEITALNNEPGINSHRWLNGKEATDEVLINHTLNRLRPYKNNQRQACLRAVIALAIPGQKTIISEANIEGYIADRPSKRRIKGYPYRSLFKVSGFNKYYDELIEEEHDQVNHRKKALERIIKVINEKLKAKSEKPGCKV